MKLIASDTDVANVNNAQKRHMAFENDVAN
uniref:Uncharacterized protein n=1 Tax=Rhizophora mucronata TaxID=61149 RepID=A0A2P2IMQ4_RHIMU